MSLIFGGSPVDINTGEIETLINAPEDNFSHIWYVSDDKIFYTRDKREKFEPYLYRYDSITKKEIKVFSYKVIAPIYLISPKGEIKIHVGSDRESGDAVITDQDGRIVSKVKYSLGGNWEAIFRDFSPNGKLLLCLEDEVSEEEETIKGDLYIYNLDGKKKKRITHTENEVEGEVKWSPNGGKIIYTVDDTENIYLMTISKK